MVPSTKFTRYHFSLLSIPLTYWHCKQFKSFFNAERFEINHYENSPSDMITYMANKLINLNIASIEFLNSVLERESMTPTSFDNKTALPHSISVSTKINCSYVIINKNPMQWGFFKVNIIILIGVNHQKRHNFKELYSNLLDILNDPIKVEKIIRCETITDFLNLLLM